METIRDRFEKVLEKIYRSARSVGRDPDTVRLVVVTKLQPVSIVREAIAAGARYLGENYAEEALEKKIALQDLSKADASEMDRHPQSFDQSIHLGGVQWHIIGHVQSRKVRLVSEYFDYIHSLDNLRLAWRLNTACTEIKRVMPVLLEFNVSGEQSKSGWIAWDEAYWEKLLPEIQQVVTLPNLQVGGLMTVPPFFENPEDARPYFQRLTKLQAYLTRHIPHTDWQELSMGMSGDFEVAVQEGATWVRIGQAILGPRPKLI